MTEEVFVWKDQGSISVYACNTPEQLQLLLDEVYGVVCLAVEEDRYDFLEKIYNSGVVSDTKLLIRRLIDEAWGCDYFEQGTGFTELRG